jgi:hypothetical protein
MLFTSHKGSPSNLLQRRSKRVICVLAANLVDASLSLQSVKVLWDVLEAKFDISDAGNDLYGMELFFYYKMVNDHSVVK